VALAALAGAERAAAQGNGAPTVQPIVIAGAPPTTGRALSDAAPCAGTGDPAVDSFGQPANDNFSSAAPLDGTEGALTGTLVGATVEDGSATQDETVNIVGDGVFIPALNYGIGAPTRSVWYCWTAPANGDFYFDTKGSPAPYEGHEDPDFMFALRALTHHADDATDRPPIVSVYTGSDWDHLQLALQPSNRGDFDAEPTAWANAHTADRTDWWTLAGFAGTQGTTYYIVVENNPGQIPDEGEFALNWQSHVIDPNDVDGDGVPNAQDNCPSVANADQKDVFPYPGGDRTGDACETGKLQIVNDGSHAVHAYDFDVCTHRVASCTPLDDPTTCHPATCTYVPPCPPGGTCMYDVTSPTFFATSRHEDAAGWIEGTFGNWVGPRANYFPGPFANIAYWPTSHWITDTSFIEGDGSTNPCYTPLEIGPAPQFWRLYEYTLDPQVVNGCFNNGYEPAQTIRFTDHPQPADPQLVIDNRAAHGRTIVANPEGGPGLACANGQRCTFPESELNTTDTKGLQVFETFHADPAPTDSLLWSATYDGSTTVLTVTGGGSLPPPPNPPVVVGTGPCHGDTGRKLAICHEDLETALDPVNLFSGAFVTSTVDARLAAAAQPFVFGRSYDSSSDATGELGPGWSDAYSTKLEVQPNGDVELVSPDVTTTFVQESPGVYYAPKGMLVDLTATPTGYELRFSDGLRYIFDGSGRLTQEVDRNGQGVTIAYGADGLRSTLTDSGGRVVSFDHDAAGLLTRLTLPGGRSVGYGYTDGRLTSVTDLRGGVTHYSYDSGGRLERIVDQNGHAVITNTYDDEGRVTGQVDALGNHSSFTWDPNTLTATTTDARGGVWTDVYDDSGRETQRTDPLGDATAFAYDDEDDLTSITNAAGDTVNMSYDDDHNLRSMSYPDGSSPYSDYNAFSEPTSTIDGNGLGSSFSYDAQGNLLQASRPDGTGTTFAYDSSGRVLSVTDPLGHATTFGYDGAGDVVSVTMPRGGVTSLGYDASGRITSLVDARGNVAGGDPDAHRTSLAYDDADHVTSVTDPLGDRTAMTYDAVGNLLTRTDADGHTTRYAYDAANRLTRVIAPDGATTVYTYDAIGDLTSRTDADGHTTAYSYDADGRLVGLLTPLGRRWTFAYDAIGDHVLTTTPSGGTIGYGYDTMGQPVSVTYSDGTPSVSYTYDLDGNVTSMTDGAGTVSYSYDAVGRLNSVTRGSDSISYAYDAADHVTGRYYADGSQVLYTYTPDGQVKTVAAGGRKTHYRYNKADELTDTVLPNGVSEVRGYDAAGRVLHVRDEDGAGNVLFKNVYTYDANGNPLTHATLDGKTSFGYDVDNRLADVCFLAAGCSAPTDPAIRFGYDAVGNRVSETRPSGTTTYSYDAGDELTHVTGPFGATSYGYDVNGNETSAGGWNYAYDLANRLTSASRGTSSIDYSYDGDGNQVSQTADGETTSLLWDPNFAAPQLASLTDATGTRSYVYGNQRVSTTTTAGTEFYATDAIGSAVGTTDAGGTVAASRSYEPFGADNTEVKGKASQEKVVPVAECVDVDTTAGTFTAHFGYVNPNAYPVSLPVGAKNKIDPAPKDRGQPTVFAPGTSDGAFAVTAPAAVTLTWTLNGKTVTASAASPGCAPASAPADPIGFAGELQDPATGLYDLRARQYDTQTGRFLGTDPLPAAVMDPLIAAYVYADDLPTALVDPTGMGAGHDNTCGSLFCWVNKTVVGQCVFGVATGALTVIPGADVGLAEYAAAGAKGCAVRAYARFVTERGHPLVGELVNVGYDVVGMAETRDEIAAAQAVGDVARVAKLQALLAAEAATAGDDVDTAPYYH